MPRILNNSKYDAVPIIYQKDTLMARSTVSLAFRNLSPSLSNTIFCWTIFGRPREGIVLLRKKPPLESPTSFSVEKKSF